ncbi:hypothetical protein EA147_17215 [Providencia stuartii]|uniref:hypothetical protein n=1 Tax=Providencia stuartii TaxID=588 RepID=UPI000EF88875|nr:hypothetical protein [Providencia stuartii]RMA08123.1 hypothetical protein EA147_17215 [Providencia stuartii]
MKRTQKVIQYIEKIMKDSTNDVDKINEFISNSRLDSLNKLQGLNNSERYIDYQILLSYLLTATDTIYMRQIYKKDNNSPYELEKLYYHYNLLFILNYNDVDKNREHFLDLAKQGEILLMDFACNDFRIGHFCYDKVIESIQSGKMAKSLPMYTRPQKLGVLAIEMLASEKNQTIDWESAGIPIDPFYQRFCQEALYNENHDVVAQWLITLCDKHIEWSALFSDNDNEQSSTGYEISMNILIPWPFEYQAVKNFRARHGLTTPIIDHPLLKTPMAIDHRPDMIGWKQNMPAIYHQMIDDLISINPELQVIHKLF